MGQRRRFLFFICLGIVALLATALPLTAQAWVGKGHMQGSVSNEEGRPIEGVKVTVRMDGEGPDPIITDKRGRWGIRGLAIGSWSVRIEKKGYMLSLGQTRV